MTYSHNQTIKALQIGIKEHCERAYERYGRDFANCISYLEHYLFFLTITFAPRSVGVYANQRRPHPLDEFAKYYFRLHRAVIGNSLDRKRLYQSATYAFADFEGSKSAGVIDFTSCDFPHVHALMLVHPDYRDQLALSATLPIFRTTTMDSVVMSQFCSEDKPLEKLIDYTMKGFAKAASKWGGSEDSGVDFLRQEFPKLGTKQTPWINLTINQKLAIERQRRII